MVSKKNPIHFIYPFLLKRRSSRKRGRQTHDANRKLATKIPDGTDKKKLQREITSGHEIKW